MSDNNPTVTVPMDGLYVHYIDVGQGDSELLCCNGQYMLIDAGVPSAGDTVVEYIRDLGIKSLTTLCVPTGTQTTAAVLTRL